MFWRFGFLCAVIAAALPAEAASPQFALEFAPQTETRWYITITSKEEKVRVKNVQINRGNCPTRSPDQMAAFPTLTFGQAFRVSAEDCVPIEISIVTDLGTATKSRVGERMGLQAEKYFHSSPRTNKIVVTNYGTDPVSISSYEINRGNCQRYTPTTNRNPLRFGDIFVSFAHCNPIEIKLETNKGARILSLD